MSNKNLTSSAVHVTISFIPDTVQHRQHFLSRVPSLGCSTGGDSSETKINLMLNVTRCVHKTQMPLYSGGILRY
jgi:hypothetical protein